MRRSQFSLLLILLGLILAVGGLIYGMRSHDLGYQSSEQGTLQHAIYQSDPAHPNNVSSGIEHLQLSNDPNIYIVNVADLANTSNLNAIAAHDYTFRYDPDTARPVNIAGKDTATNTATYTLIGTSYKAVEIIGFDSSNQPVNILTDTLLQNHMDAMKTTGLLVEDWPCLASSYCSLASSPGAARRPLTRHRTS